MARKFRIRTALREDDEGGAVASIVVWYAQKAVLVRVAVESDRTEVRAGAAAFNSSAIGPDANAVLPDLPLGPLAVWECRAMGFDRGSGRHLYEAILDALDPASGPRGDRQGYGPLDTHYGTPVPRPAFLANLSRTPLRVPPAEVPSPVSGWHYEERLANIAAEWIGAVSDRIDGPVGLGFLTVQASTARVMDWFLDGGERGERRRQAGRLQPGFAPVLAGEPALSAAIDAGRPFEPLLLDVVRAWLPPEVRGVLDLPRLRRVRGVAFAGADRMATLLAHWSRYPLHALPLPGGANQTAAWLASEVDGLLDALGLPLAPLVAEPNPGWMTRQGEVPDPMDRFRTTLIGAFDMASDLARTLVDPLLASVSEPGAHPDPAACERIAGRLLFSGMRIGEVAKASLAWHEGLDDLREIAQLAAEDLSWPALFDEFDAGHGVTVTCLNTAGDLLDEGRHGPDAAGVEGLAHCVGTYARRCARGSVHILSVRRMGVRLSTVSLGRNAVGRLSEWEHRGRRNSQPPAAAEAAMRLLWLAEIKGKLTFNPEALVQRRDVPPPRPGSAAALHRLASAWGPHLPRGLDESLTLTRRLAEIMDADAVHRPRPAEPRRGLPRARANR